MPESNRKPIQYSVGLLLLVLTLISVWLAAVFWYIKVANGTSEIATFDCGNDREIVIVAARLWEYSQPIYYLVRVNGKTVVPTTYIGNNDPDTGPSTIRFTKFATSNGNLVGITYTEDSSDYLVVHDFSSNVSFPHDENINWEDAPDAGSISSRSDRARVQLENQLNASRKK